jgi:Protein of unknown function (DUF1353)
LTHCAGEQPTSLTERDRGRRQLPVSAGPVGFHRAQNHKSLQSPRPPIAAAITGGLHMPFVGELVAQQVEDFEWKLIEPLSYRDGADIYDVPAGSETDFASVPLPLQWLIPRSGRYTKAAVVHDHLWQHGGEVGIPRSAADRVFRQAMADLEVPFLRRWIMWAAVRVASLFGSRFRDGPRDVVRVLLLFLFPGLFVLLGGAVVGALLLGFWLLEYISTPFLGLIRATPRGKARTKPIVRPTVRWDA